MADDNAAITINSRPLPNVSKSVMLQWQNSLSLVSTPRSLIRKRMVTPYNRRKTAKKARR